MALRSAVFRRPFTFFSDHLSLVRRDKQLTRHICPAVRSISKLWHCHGSINRGRGSEFFVASIMRATASYILVSHNRCLTTLGPPRRLDILLLLVAQLLPMYKSQLEGRVTLIPHSSEREYTFCWCVIVMVAMATNAPAVHCTYNVRSENVRKDQELILSK